MPKAKGTRGNLRGKPKGGKPSGGSLTAPPDKDTPTIAELGLSKKRASRARKLAGWAGSLAILRSPRKTKRRRVMLR
jgi:hypothetical protein